jgi:hypothetical protein
VLEVHRDIQDVLCCGDVFALRRRDELTVWSAHTAMRTLRIPAKAVLALSARGTVAIVHDGRVRLASPFEAGRTSLAPSSRIHAATFIGDSERLALVVGVYDEHEVHVDEQRVRLDQPASRLWVAASGEALCVQLRGTSDVICHARTARMRLTLPGEPCGFDGARLYAVTKSGALFTLDIRTGSWASTDFAWPLRRVAANETGIAWLTDEGNIDRIRFERRSA